MIRTGWAMAAAAAFMLTGCASSLDSTLRPSSLDGVPTVQVVRGNTPSVEARTLTGAVLFAAGGALVKPLGVLHDGARTDEARQQIGLPDYTGRVTALFLERARTQVPGWPSTAMGRDEQSHNPTLHIKTFFIRLSSLAGLWTAGSATLVSPGGEVLWKRTYRYTTFDHNRPNQRSFEEYQQDQGRLFAAELEHAASMVADEFILHLRDGREGELSCTLNVC